MTTAAELPADPRDARTAWDAQPGEPPRAYHWFTRFVALGPERSLSRVVSDAYGANQAGTKRVPNLSQLKKWSTRWKWQDRAAAHDADLAKKQRERQEDSLLAAAEASAVRLRSFMNAISQPIEGLLRTILTPEYQQWYDDLTPEAKWSLAAQMAKMLPALQDAERIALGARLDAASQLAASNRIAEEQQGGGLLEMESLERVAQVLSILEEAGFRPRPGKRERGR